MFLDFIGHGHLQRGAIETQGMRGYEVTFVLDNEY
jgi:hypothetical protein